MSFTENPVLFGATRIPMSRRQFTRRCHGDEKEREGVITPERLMKQMFLGIEREREKGRVG